MHCTNCGANLTNTDKFCKACGYSVNGNYSNNNYNYNNNYNNNPQNGPKKEPLAVASLIIGIISLTLAIFFNFTILPLAFLGLILGIVNKATKGKKIAGIVLNIFAIVVVIGGGGFLFYNYVIKPLQTDRFYLKLSINCIIRIKIANIINMIIKNRSEEKNERTSNRSFNGNYHEQYTRYGRCKHYYRSTN